jgi:hypothetical protein
MSSTSTFPPSAEPPRNRPQVPQRSSLVTELLIGVGRVRRGRRARVDGFDPALLDLGYANPPEYLDGRIIWQVLDRVPRENLELAHDADLPLSEPGPLATAWAARIALAVERLGLDSIVTGVHSVGYGFVAHRQQIGFGLVCYVRRPALVQAAPLAIDVDGVQVPVVLRPIPRDVDLAGGLRFPDGQAAGSARIGTDLGTLTAAHVVAPNGQSDGIAEGQSVLCCEPACPGHLVLRADPVMDAALIEMAASDRAPKRLRVMPVAGYFPVELISPTGQPVPAWITEVGFPQGVIPGSRGKRPTSPALLLLSASGAHGWSGSLVLETQSRELFGGPGLPYGMFLGVRELHGGVAGRMNMLAQLEKVWDLELVED